MKEMNILLKMDAKSLPVSAFKHQIIRAVNQNTALIIVAETGSGKSKQIPQFLHKSGLTKCRKLAVTQPRRIGAISVATRVSDEIGCHLGGKFDVIRFAAVHFFHFFQHTDRCLPTIIKSFVWFCP